VDRRYRVRVSLLAATFCESVNPRTANFDAQ